MSDEFKIWWNQAFDTVPPVGWLLREALHGRWFRVHTLPESKRYPETESEYGEALRRQAALGDEVLGTGNPCWIVVPEYRIGSEASVEFPEIPATTLGRGLVFSDDDPDDPPMMMTAWVAEVAWSPASSLTTRRAIIDDKFRALWVSKTTAEVFAPYDGGVDVIVATSTRRDELVAKYASWLSPHPTGM
jgi:hypothetical protein